MCVVFGRHADGDGFGGSEMKVDEVDKSHSKRGESQGKRIKIAMKRH